jgi:hypothetical protein
MNQTTSSPAMPFTDPQPLKRVADDIASLGVAANEPERYASKMASATRAASGIAQSHTLTSTQTQRIVAEMRAAEGMMKTQRIVDEMHAAEAMTNRYTAGVVETPPLKLLRSPIEAGKKEPLRIELTLSLMESVATPVSSPIAAATITPRRDPGGAPPKYPWDDVAQKLMLHLANEGMPETKSELVRWTIEFATFADGAKLSAPDESTARAFLRKKFPQVYQKAGKN